MGKGEEAHARPCSVTEGSCLSPVLSIVYSLWSTFNQMNLGQSQRFMWPSMAWKPQNCPLHGGLRWIRSLSPTAQTVM